MKWGLIPLAGILLLSTSALATDLPTRQVKPYQPVQVYDWTGFYLGAHGGYGWSEADAETDALPAPLPPFSLSASTSADGWFYGVELAALRQMQSGLVLGVVADWSWTNMDGSSDLTLNGCATCPTSVGSYSYEIEQFGTARAVLGYAADRWLPYLTGGIAYAKGKATASVGGTSVTAKSDHVGYAVGAGLKYAFNDRISLSTEYLYADFGRRDYAFELAGPISVTGKTKLDAHLVKTGLAVKF